MNSPLPITVLAGYLGSGKTSLINHMLATPRGIKLAVIVNDFGRVNVDATLIRAEGARTIELTNGCVCCSIGDDLGSTLSDIAAWQEPPDQVLLEASGVAEPARIAMTAGNWPGYRLASLIVTADALTVRTRARDKFVGTLVLSQLRSAGMIVVTKTDLLTEHEAEAVRTWLAGVAPGTRIVIGSGSALRAEFPLGASLPVPARTPSFSADPPAHFSNACWWPDGPVDIDTLRACLAALPAGVHRVKGIVTDAATGTGLIVHYASNRFHTTPAIVTEPSCLVLVSTGPQDELDALCQELKKKIAP